MIQNGVSKSNLAREVNRKSLRILLATCWQHARNYCLNLTIGPIFPHFVTTWACCPIKNPLIPFATLFFLLLG
jgi:hypothetical protein